MKILPVDTTHTIKRAIGEHARLALVAAALYSAGLCMAHASDTPPSANATPQGMESATIADFCFLSGAPPSDVRYSRIREMKLGKGSYGGVTDIVGKLAEQARMLGADAMINYTGSQRFGFWPWRVVRPVVRGTAVKWEGPTKPDCGAMGGSTLSEILVSNRPPGQ